MGAKVQCTKDIDGHSVRGTCDPHTGKFTPGLPSAPHTHATKPATPTAVERGHNDKKHFGPQKAHRELVLPSKGKHEPPLSKAQQEAVTAKARELEEGAKQLDALINEIRDRKARGDFRPIRQEEIAAIVSRKQGTPPAETPPPAPEKVTETVHEKSWAEFLDEAKQYLREKFGRSNDKPSESARVLPTVPVLPPAPPIAEAPTGTVEPNVFYAKIPTARSVDEIAQIMAPGMVHLGAMSEGDNPRLALTRMGANLDRKIKADDYVVLTKQDNGSFSAEIVRDREWKERVIRGRMKPLLDEFTKACDAHHVPLYLALSVGHIESGFQADIPPSEAGALGLMQVLPGTANLITGRSLSTDEIVNVHNNINLGVAYLGQLLKRFDGNEILAVAAYHAGPERESFDKGKIPPIPATVDYVRMVTEVAKRVYLPEFGTTDSARLKLGDEMIASR